jgi:transposase InsO family protein
MQPHFASSWQKNGRARRQARRCRASEGRTGPLRTAGLQHRQRRSQDDPLPVMPATELRLRLRDLANKRKRFGYRRLFVLLRQEGESSGINRIYRLYREEGLTVRKRRARRRAVGARAPILVEAKPSPGNAWRQSRTPQSRDAGFSNFLFSTQPFLARCVKHWQHNGCKGRKSISQHTPC